MFTIFGASGSGKTCCLMEIEQQFASDQVIRVGAETLIETICSGVRTGLTAGNPISRYRKINTLLLDNLWVLASRPHISREVYALLDTRQNDNLLTVLASDLTLQHWSKIHPAMAQLMESGEMIRLSLLV